MNILHGPHWGGCVTRTSLLAWASARHMPGTEQENVLTQAYVVAQQMLSMQDGNAADGAAVRVAVEVDKWIGYTQCRPHGSDGGQFTSS